MTDIEHASGDDILSRYPGVAGSPRIMAMMSAALLQKGKIDDAVAMALIAVDAAPADMVVWQTVRAALNVGVPRFHDTMLRDIARARAYADAIERAVRPGMTVLEIGAGSGLLALIAARAGAQVVTCEAVPAIAATARAIVARNGYADRVRVVAKRSTDLQIGVDLDAPADLVIHEIFGEKLFNEGVTVAMTDARARLLKPGAPSVPPRAAVRVALVETLAGRRQPIGRVEGFDLSPFELLMLQTQGNAVAGTQRIVARSDAASLLRMDYDTPAPFGPQRETARLMSTGGRIDAVAQWLELDFGDGQVLASDPFAEGPPSSWVARLFELGQSIETAPGDAIDVTARHNGAVLTIDAVAVSGSSTTV